MKAKLEDERTAPVENLVTFLLLAALGAGAYKLDTMVDAHNAELEASKEKAQAEAEEKLDKWKDYVQTEVLRRRNVEVGVAEKKASKKGVSKKEETPPQ